MVTKRYLYWRQHAKIHALRLTNTHQTFTINHTKYHLMIENSNTILKAFINDTSYQMSLGPNEEIEMVDQIFFTTKCDEEDTVFQAYTFTKPFIIGQQQDISSSLPNWLKVHFRIYPQSHMIHVGTNEMACLNDIPIIKSISYKPGDTFSFLNFRMVLFEGYLLCNLNTTLTIHLQPYHPTNQQPLTPLTTISHLPGYATPFQTSYNMQLQLPPKPITIQNEKSVWMMIGPTLTMSLAMVTISGVNAYDNYQNGSSLLTVLPGLLFPLTMCFSTLLWGIINHISDHLHKKQEIQKYNYEIEQQIHKETQKIIHWKQQTLAQMEQQYPDFQTLCQRIEDGDCFSMHASQQQFCLRLGSTRDILEITQNHKLPKDLSIQLDPQFYPWIVDFKEIDELLILKSQDAYALFVYMILQIVIYTGLPIWIICTETFSTKYTWIKKIPNTYFKQRRLISTNPQNEQQIFSLLQNQDCFVFVFDGYSHAFQKDFHHVIYFQKQEELRQCNHILDLNKHTYDNYNTFTSLEFQTNFQIDFNPDDLFSHFDDAATFQMRTSNGILSLFRVNQAKQLDFLKQWQNNQDSAHRIAYLGKDDRGNRITLDLSEEGDGPHGLVAGMTGSGKSELLTTLLMSLAIRYSNEEIQFAFIDFKGGGIVQAFQSYHLPHIAGILTNLDESQMARALVSFHLECMRRETLFHHLAKTSGQPVINLQSYRRMRKIYPQFDSLADLVIVVDEFAELKKQQPDFMKDLISISRIGRSLGIHLLLATQKPSGVVNDEIWSNCSFKICLKVSQRADSFEMLHHDGALHLKNPGRFILQTTDREITGQSAYANQKNPVSLTTCVLLDETGQVYKDSRQVSQMRQPELTEILSYMEQHGKRNNQTYPLWLPPLASSTLQPLKPMQLGWVDDYYHHRYDALSINTHTMFFMTPYLEEKEQFIDTLLDVLIKEIQKKDELYLIDDLNLSHLQELSHSCVFNGCLYCEEEEKIINVLKHLLSHHRSTNHIFLIITDVRRFLDTNERYGQYLHQILQEAVSKDIHVILAGSDTQALSYRDLSLITQKLCGRNEAVQEIQQLFSIPEKKIQKQPFHGFVHKEHLLEFCYPKTPFDTVQQHFQQVAFTYGQNPNYTIPYMPKRLTKEQGSDEIVLGKFYDDYTWLTLDFNASMYVISKDAYEWEEYYSTMRMCCKCVIDSYDIHEDHLIFLNLNAYQQTHLDLPVLFIGKGYDDQYTFRSEFHHLEKNQGIYFYHGKARKVRLLDG